MIDLKRKAKRGQDTFHSPSGTTMLSKYWESTLEYLLSRGLFLYVKTSFDTETKREGDLIFNADHCTREIIERELTDKIIDIISSVQQHMDSVARSKGYDNIFTSCTYAGSNHPRFGPQGNACRDWRDAVWNHCFSVLDDVESGSRTEPTGEELISELPEMIWPD